MGEQTTIVDEPGFYSGRFHEDMRRALLEVGIFCYRDEEKKRIKTDGDVSITKFLNRLLGLEMATQQPLFVYFRYLHPPAFFAFFFCISFLHLFLKYYFPPFFLLMYFTNLKKN